VDPLSAGLGELANQIYKIVTEGFVKHVDYEEFFVVAVEKVKNLVIQQAGDNQSYKSRRL